jgi:hypothetical protein
MLTPAFAPLGPDPREKLPQQAISVLEGGTRDLAPEHHELVAQGDGAQERGALEPGEEGEVHELDHKGGEH